MHAMMRSSSKSLPNFFKYSHQRVQEAVLICLNRFHLRKLAEYFIYKLSLVITGKLPVAIFLKAFAMVKKKKSRDKLYVCKLD